IVKKGTIIIDARLLRKGVEGRLRFTLAHELAHWILHKNIFCGSQYSAAMIKGALHNDNKLSSEADRMIEKQADLLATALLMPIKQVKKAFYELRSKYFDKTVLVAKMAETFDVSRQAMRICLTNHNLI
ncbi:MAG: ImmA/IrrE family metallo-endopeptidase, partial [Bacillota bacterium]